MLKYQIDPVAGIVEITGEPIGTPHEAVRFFNALVAEPTYRRGFGILRDRRGVRVLSSADVDRYVMTIAGFPQMAGSRWAVLVDDPANFGTMRMASTIASWNDFDVRVFNDEAEARRWLGERRPLDQHTFT